MIEDLAVALMVINKAKRSRWRHILYLLREGTLPPHPVTVLTVKMSAEDGWGTTGWSEKKQHFTIRLSKDLSEHARELVLLHEWAHVLSWAVQEVGDTQDHDVLWGAAYARTYRAYIGGD